jgi:putative peptidoglycan lipid II flippase
VSDPLETELPNPNAPEPPIAAPTGTKARTVLSITIARLLSVILGLAREVLASAYYGTSAQFSAFAIAFQVPTTAQILIGQGALSSAVLPILVEYDEDGNIEGFAALVSRLLLMLTVSLVVVSFIFILVAPPLFELFLGSAFSDSIRQLTIDLSQLLFPVVILLGAQSLSVAVLNSHNRFTIAAYAPAVWNVAVVALLVILRPHFHGDHAIYAYAVAVLAGSLAQLIWLLPGLRLVSWKALRSKAVDRQALRRIVIRIAPVAFVTAAWQADLIINLVVGSAVSEAAPRALQAAQRLSSVGAGLVSVAISTVAFPAFRRHTLRGEHTELAGLIERSIRMNITLLAPVAAIIVVVATPFTAVMYERGEFGPHSTELVASALVWIILSLPAGGIWDLLTKACFAADSYWPAAFIGIVGLILDLVMSIVFEKLFGISGIALASTASFTISTVIIAIYVRARLISYRLSQVFWSAVRLAAAAAAAAVLAWLLVGALVPSGTGEFGDDLVTLVATSAFAMVFYGGAIRLLSPADSAIFWFQLGRAMPGRLRSRRGGGNRP